MPRVAFVLAPFCVCVALTVPAFAESQAATQIAGAQAKGDALAACQEPSGQESVDDTYRWRLRAYRYLDCVMNFVDDALKRAGESGSRGSEDQRVTLSRHDLERIRTLALWAKDAAARIGR